MWIGCGCCTINSPLVRGLRSGCSAVARGHEGAVERSVRHHECLHFPGLWHLHLAPYQWECRSRLHGHTRQHSCHHLPGVITFTWGPSRLTCSNLKNSHLPLYLPGESQKVVRHTCVCCSRVAVSSVTLLSTSRKANAWNVSGGL